MTSAERPRVLQLVANLDRGGGQEVVRTLARHLPGAGVDPVVVTLRDGPLRAAIEGDGVPVEVVAGRTRPITSGPGAVRELLRIRDDLAAVAVRHHASIVQTHLLGSLDFLALSLRGRAGVRRVFWTVHNAMLELRVDQVPASQRRLLGAKRAAQRLAYRTGGRRVDGFIAVSTEVGAAVRRAYRPPADRLFVIPNGVDVDRYGTEVDRGAVRERLGISETAPLAIVVAKLMEQKGHAVLLDALASLGHDATDLHTVLVGDGDLRADLEAQARRLGLDGRVHLVGARSDIPDLLAASDLFILPSRWEGLPMALLEALASRLPVIASSVSGTREVIEHGTHGLLVSPGDPRALADAIARMRADPQGAARMGVAGRHRVEDCYSADAHARQHASLYRAHAAWIEGTTE